MDERLAIECHLQIRTIVYTGGVQTALGFLIYILLSNPPAIAFDIASRRIQIKHQSSAQPSHQYGAIMDQDNPQTLIWRTKEPRKVDALASITALWNMDNLAVCDYL